MVKGLENLVPRCCTGERLDGNSAQCHNTEWKLPNTDYLKEREHRGSREREIEGGDRGREREGKRQGERKGGLVEKVEKAWCPPKLKTTTMEDWIPKLCWGSFPLNPDCPQHTEFPDRVMWQLYAGNVQEGQDYKALEKVSLLVYALCKPLNPRIGSNLGIHPSIFACPWKWWQDDADPSWNCAQGSIYPRHLSIRALMHRDWQPLTLTSTPTANLDPCYPVRLYVLNKSFSIYDIVWFPT